MCETVALLINLPQDKVRRIFSRLQSHLLTRNDDPFLLKQNKALKGYDGNFPRTLAPLELCQIKRKLLGSKPIWFNKTLTTSLRIFRYKIDTTEMIDALVNAGLTFRRITNRISKKSKLIAIENCQLRIKRIAYIRSVQRFREEGKNRRIIYINSMLMSDKMIVIAATSDGPVTSAFINNNAIGFLNWLSKDICENVKDRCVFILGPSCTFRNESIVPKQTDTKETLIAWLRSQNITFDETLYKTELYDLILQHCKDYPAEAFYVVNDHLAKMNQDVLHIPNENRDLVNSLSFMNGASHFYPLNTFSFQDPFEYLWFQVKLRMIANGTASFNINRQLCTLPKEIWSEQFERIEAIQNAYLQIERNFDRTYRRFRVDNDDFKTNEILNATDYVETC